MTPINLSSPSDPEEQNHLWAVFVETLRVNPEWPFEDHWNGFEQIFAKRKMADGPPVVWQPDEKVVTHSNLGQTIEELGLDGYDALYNWSVTHRATFWDYVIRRLGIVFKKKPDDILDLSRGPQDPEWLPGAEMNIVDSCFTANPGKPAIICGGEGSSERSVVTYGELERQVNQFANGLQEQGIKPDTAIAIYMPMNTGCIVAYLGIIRAGCRVVSIADSFSPAEVTARMKIADSSIILTVESYIRAGKVIGMYEKVCETDADRVIVIPTREDHPPRLRENDILWHDLLSENDRFESVTGNPYRVSNILFSSGTTGDPKAIPWTHLTPLKGGMDGHFHHDIHPDDVVAWPTNIGWMMGPWLIYASLLNRATMALYEGAPLGQHFTRFIQDAEVSMLGVIPSLVRVWRTTGAMEGVDWSTLRVLSSTGEPSNREDYLWLMSCMQYRIPIIEYLGGTEIGGGHLACSLMQPASPSTFTTPALGISFVILNEEEQPVDEGEMGELFLIPPSIGLSQTILNKDHDEVYYEGCPSGPNQEVLRRHGDQTLRMAHGFYRAQGRADDTMNLGGIKVSSLELEHIVDTHEAVYESAAVAVQPGGEGAEQLVVFVQLNQARDQTELMKDLSRLIGKQLNPLFKIHDLVITDDLPRTASNKLMRRTLRARYLER